MAAHKTNRKSAGKKTTKTKSTSAKASADKSKSPGKKSLSAGRAGTSPSSRTAKSKPGKHPGHPKKPSFAKTSADKKKNEKSDGYFLAESVVNGILEKKGENITWLDLRSIENAVCEYFIICEGNSKIQVQAIADSVEEIVKKQTGQKPYRSEGRENSLWVLIDYVNVVVHVFQREARQFYNLESLWADAETVKHATAKRA